MDNESAPLTSDSAGEAGNRSLAEELRSIADEGRTWVQSELAWQKSRAAHAGRNIKGVVIFGALAAALMLIGLLALPVGFVLALTPVLGGWGATGAVFAAMLLMAMLCGLIALLRWKRLMRAISDKSA